jgi:hypothetical protein
VRARRKCHFFSPKILRGSFIGYTDLNVFVKQRMADMLLEQIAKQLNILPEKLERESLKVYLQRNLRLIESELFGLARRYGVRSVTELDEKIQQGAFHEDESFEDFFRFDHLENERRKHLEILETL